MYILKYTHQYTYEIINRILYIGNSNANYGLLLDLKLIFIITFFFPFNSFVLIVFNDWFDRILNVIVISKYIFTF